MPSELGFARAKAMAAGGLGFVAVGEWSDSDGYINAARAALSDDGSSWIVAELSGDLAEVYDIYVGDGVALAAGCAHCALEDRTGYVGRVWRTTDGTKWRAESVPDAAEIFAVLSFQGGFVAVGTSGAKCPLLASWTSSDGIRWSRASNVDGDQCSAVDVEGAVVFGASVLLFGTVSAPGQGRLVWASRDGHQWIRSEQGAGMWSPWLVTPTQLIAIGCDDVAVPCPTVAWRTTDGATWNSIELPFDPASATMISDGLWLASEARVGLSLWQSADGTAWQPIAPLPSTGPADGWISALAVRGSRVLAIGTSHYGGPHRVSWSGTVR